MTNLVLLIVFVVACVMAIISLPFSLYAIILVKAMEKSTHRVVWKDIPTTPEEDAKRTKEFEKFFNEEDDHL